MNKKTLIIIILSLLGVTLIGGILFVASAFKKDSPETVPTQVSSGSSDTSPGSSSDTGNDITYIPTPGNSPTPVMVPTPTPEPEIPFVPATEMDLDPSSITVFVNKEFALPKNYKPENLVIPNIYFDLTYFDERTMMRAEAAEALEKLFAEADKQGYKLCGVSGYRSYARQYDIFTNNILTKGKDHTLRYSAVPGTSEHQTGLAMDVSCESLRYNLSDTFSETPEGKWLADNAYRFGYIIRYPKGKGKITGYAYEPWHIRYVGKGLAKYLYENDLTLEEYYKYQPSEDFDFEALYADLINITPSVTPTPTGMVSPTGSISPTVTPVTPTGTAVSSTPVPDHPKATITPTASPTNGASSGDTGTQDGQPGSDSGNTDNGTQDSGNGTNDGGTVSVTPALITGD